MRMPTLGRTGRLVALAASAVVVTTAGVVLASDHQDTPEVELNPRLDINDVYVFPGANPDRLVLAVSTSSPLTPAGSVGATFDPGELYQIKIDNTGDAVEDLVLQFTFDAAGPGQQVTLLGPAAPEVTGRKGSLLSVSPAVSGPINTVSGEPLGHPALRRPAGGSFLHRPRAVLPHHPGSWACTGTALEDRPEARGHELPRPGNRLFDRHQRPGARRRAPRVHDPSPRRRRQYADRHLGHHQPLSKRGTEP